MARWRKSKREQVDDASEDETSLGNILIRRGFATPAQIHEAIERQLAVAPPLGEILVEMRAITLSQLEEALYEQRRLRGQISIREEVQHHMTQQSRHMQQITEGFDEIKDLSRALVTKMGRR